LPENKGTIEDPIPWNLLASYFYDRLFLGDRRNSNIFILSKATRLLHEAAQEIRENINRFKEAPAKDSSNDSGIAKISGIMLVALGLSLLCVIAFCLLFPGFMSHSICAPPVLAVICGLGMCAQTSQTKDRFNILFYVLPGFVDEKEKSYLTLASLIAPFDDKYFLARLVEGSGFPKDILRKDIAIKVFYSGDHSDARKGLKNMGPADMVCVSATSCEIEEALAAARIAKAVHPKAVRVIGGAHASVRPQDFLKKGAYHLACLGEGTEMLAQLAALVAAGSRDFRKLQGAVFNKNGRLNVNRRKSFLFSLDDYPWFSIAAYNLFKEHLLDRAYHAIEILGGMGCPNNCYFCAQRAVHQGRIRQRSAESIIEEMSLWVPLDCHRKRKITILDENFPVNKKRLSDFLDLIKRYQITCDWMVQADAISLTVEELRRMAACGLKVIEFGIESADPKVLDAANKRIDLEHALRLIFEAKRLGVKVNMYFLAGLPGQDAKSVELTRRFMEKAGVDEKRVSASCNITIPYPGTEFSNRRLIRILDKVDGKSNFPYRTPEKGSRWMHTETDEASPSQIGRQYQYLRETSAAMTLNAFKGRVGSLLRCLADGLKVTGLFVFNPLIVVLPAALAAGLMIALGVYFYFTRSIAPYLNSRIPLDNK
jgi:radical SAM superfamily enzyme YgiQ (UPF0313 family)